MASGGRSTQPWYKHPVYNNWDSPYLSLNLVDVSNMVMSEEALRISSS
jgi:hypothetical protein